MKHYLCIIAILAICYPTMQAQNHKQAITEANEAYQKGDFQKASQVYEQILTGGYHSPTLYYNLGNAYFRTNQLGKSLLNFERALLLAPNDADIKHNIRVANQKVRERPEAVSDFFLERWWNNWRQMFSATTWGSIGLTFLWLGVGGLVIYILGHTRQMKKIGFIGGIVLLLISILPFSLAFSRADYEKNTDHGIVVQRESELYSAPDEASQSVLKVYEGLKVQMLDKIENWHKVRLVNGEVGWLEEKTLEEI